MHPSPPASPAVAAFVAAKAANESPPPSPPTKVAESPVSPPATPASPGALAGELSPEAEAVARDLEGGTFSDAAKEEGHWVRTDSGQWVAAPEVDEVDPAEAAAAHGAPAAVVVAAAAASEAIADDPPETSQPSSVAEPKSPEPVQARFVPPPQTTPVTEDPPDPPTWTPASPPPAMKPRSPPRSPPRVPDLQETASNSPMEMATPRGDAENSLEAARAAAVVAAATPMPAPPVQRRRSVEPCLAEVIDGLKLKPAQAESLEQLLDEHEVHDLATAQILDAEDFKEIGIKVGTRKKLLERLASSASEA